LAQTPRTLSDAFTTCAFVILYYNESMTTAATTEFALERIKSHGYTIAFDGNQKVTAGNGTFEEPVANSISLVQSQDCPFSTPTCDDSCYVHQLEKYHPEIHNHYKRNSAEIRALLVDDRNIYKVALDIADWITKNCAGGFRWHVSGDIFSYDYADWIASVVTWSPDVQHWIYTRSFPFLNPILDVPNLTVNLSADKDNYWLARRYANEHNLRVCYLTVDGEVPGDLREGDVIFPDYALRGVDEKPHTFREGSEWWKGLKTGQRKMVCPVDVYGKSDKVRCGPCSKCID
jgi:hypothetical protein